MNRYQILKSAGQTGALFFALVFPVWGEAGALTTDETRLEFGVSALRFDYTEYKSDGSQWDRELGGMPGLAFRVVRREAGWEGEGLLDYHAGQVGYNGQSTTGSPYSTHTDEMIGDMALRLGRWVDAGIPLLPYGGLGYRRWERSILPGSLAGLKETYEWLYLWLGVRAAVYQSSAFDVALDSGWLRPLNPSMQVDAYHASLNPEARNGWRFKLTSQLSFSEQLKLILEPYYEYWELGVSPGVTSGAYTIYEPASKTRRIQI